MASPQQEIYVACKNTCIDVLGIDNVYDFLPSDDAKYPFIMVGETYSTDDPNKTAIFGEYTQTIHVHHNDFYERTEVTKIMNEILTNLRKMKSTSSFFVYILRHNQQTMTDQIGSQQFIHGVLEITFKFYGKGR